jgi:hypothetical protein
VLGSCEYSNEPVGVIKDRKFLDKLSIVSASASQEGVCSMELVGWLVVIL